MHCRFAAYAFLQYKKYYFLTSLYYTSNGSIAFLSLLDSTIKSSRLIEEYFKKAF